RVFVNAVDDPAHASAYLSGVVRRDGVTVAISTSGVAPGLVALLRQALDHLLPSDLAAWVEQSRLARANWRRDGVPMDQRRALNALSEGTTESAPPSEPPTNTSGFGSEGGRHAEPSQATPQAAMTHVDEHGRQDRTTSGRVSLVGAGPGDPGLLTRRAVARL